MIPQQVIDNIKASIDLRSLIESRGIILKKNGTKGYVGLCPFHDDTNPSLSVTPSKNLWQCFGCGAGGDAIRFVEMFDKVEFKEAVEVLAETAGVVIDEASSNPAKGTSSRSTVKKATKKATSKSSIAKSSKATKAKPAASTSAQTLSIPEKKLLARVVSYYQHTLGEDQRGLEYLTNDRGVSDIRSLKDFGVGYANGTLMDILPEDESVLKMLKRIGILNAKGQEFLFNCVVFPLYSPTGSVVSLYGRHIDDNSSVHHLYLPGPMQGIVNRQAVRRSQTILLTESIIDALTLYDQGFKNVMPIYGTNGMTDELLGYLHKKVREAYLVFDADDPGRKAMDAVSVRLNEKNIVAHCVTLPVKDVNIYFNRHTPEEFEALIRKANPQSGEYSEKVAKRNQAFYEATQSGFKVGFGDDRQYEIKGIQRGDTQLKVTVKASSDLSGSSTMPFELTTIDLYSSRSRLWFAKMCSDLFGAVEELVKEDIGRLLNLVEEYKPKQPQSDKPKPTQDEIKMALKFLKSPTMFDDILLDLETMGITGEKTNKLVGYLAAVSRKLEDPLSVLVQSRSAAGKSTLQDAVLSLVPDEDYVKYTRVTDQALFYKDEDSLVHKILAIEEEEGMGGAAYSIRNIQSSKKITVAATGKDPGTGRMKTEEYTVKGPVCVMITTTAAELEGETASRFIFLTIDESSKMTEAIHRMQRESETLEGLVRRKQTEHIIKKHHTAQRMLKPLAVVNPFTQYLSYPSTSIRTRRDHKKYLGLIRATAFLHQHQRKVQTVQVEGKPVEYIEVTLDDIELANRLANEVLGQCLDELAPPSRTLLEGIYNMAKEMTCDGKVQLEDIFFTRRMVREHTGWTDWQVKTHIKQLEEMEYLKVRMGSRGKEYSYVLSYKGQGGTDPEERFYLNLTPVEEIQRLMKGGSGDDKVACSRN